MSGPPDTPWWRVGYHADPLGFTSLELSTWNHRFDDPTCRFRTLYLAAQPETWLREVLADFRPYTAAIERFRARFGDAGVADIPARPVTAAWRRQNVLAGAALELDGPLLDLCDPGVRHDVEQ